jgi:hypothetical protein
MANIVNIFLHVIRTFNEKKCFNSVLFSNSFLRLRSERSPKNLKLNKNTKRVKEITAFLAILALLMQKNNSVYENDNSELHLFPVNKKFLHCVCFRDKQLSDILFRILQPAYFGIHF